MPHPSRRKGTTFENEIAHEFWTHGFTVQRAWGSDGRSLNRVAAMDILARSSSPHLDLAISCKRRAALPKFLEIPPGIDAVVFREDRAAPKILLTLSTFFNFTNLQV